MKDHKHPTQPTELDERGVLRFRRNAIICWLCDTGRLNLNETRMLPGVSDEDHQQLAQLLGYSVSGYGDLSYVDDAAWERVDDGDPTEDEQSTVTEVAPDDRCYYILDARSVVGNCAMWWCPDGQGYTCEIGKAGLYTAAEIKGMRITDVPIHRSDVERLTLQHVRVDHLRQAGLLAEYDRQMEAERKEEKVRAARARREARRRSET